MVLASSLLTPIFLTLLRLSQEPERNSGGLPLAVVPVIILLILLLIFLSAYFTSTGIQGKPAAATAVPHDIPHHDEAALQTEVVETAVAVAEVQEMAVAVVEEKETAVTISEPAPSAMTLVEEEPAPIVVPDDLKIIEGIGPKIEGVLHAAGIQTFAQLAVADVSRLEQIVREDAGLRLAFPHTWAEQARLAATGDWAALEELQEELKGGRRE